MLQVLSPGFFVFSVFFLKGSVYLSGHGSEERINLVPLHDVDNGVIMSLHCFEKHQEQLLPENVEYCERLHERYDDFEYEDIMNTTFGLVPAGRSPGSYRLGEVGNVAMDGLPQSHLGREGMESPFV